jgi:hypothetical protein
MGLEIKISAEDMVRVLVKAGISTTEAKAITFDFLQYPEKLLQDNSDKVATTSSPTSKLQSLPRKRRTRQQIEADAKTTASDDVVDVFESEDSELAGVGNEDEGIVGFKKPKHISFKNFGGVAQGLTP